MVAQLFCCLFLCLFFVHLQPSTARIQPSNKKTLYSLSEFNTAIQGIKRESHTTQLSPASLNTPKSGENLDNTKDKDKNKK